MTTPLEKIAPEKNGNYQSSVKGGRGAGVPLIGKRPIYVRFFSFEGLNLQTIASGRPVAKSVYD